MVHDAGQDQSSEPVVIPALAQRSLRFVLSKPFFRNSSIPLFRPGLQRENPGCKGAGQMVPTGNTTSSNASRSARTVSGEVRAGTPFSAAHCRIPVPAECAWPERVSRVLMK